MSYLVPAQNTYVWLTGASRTVAATMYSKGGAVDDKGTAALSFSYDDGGTAAVPSQPTGADGLSWTSKQLTFSTSEVAAGISGTLLSGMLIGGALVFACMCCRMRCAVRKVPSRSQPGRITRFPKSVSEADSVQPELPSSDENQAAPPPSTQSQSVSASV